MEKYEPDTLYIGPTRPAMVVGMPYKYFMFAMMFYGLLFFMTKSFILMFGLPPVLWLFGLELGRRDPKLAEIWLTKIQLPNIKKRYLNYWKTRTYGNH